MGLHLHHRRMRRAFGFSSSILRLPATGDGGDGGGGASGDGGGSRSEPGGGDAAKTGITKDDADAMITKAINARFKAFEEKQAKATEASNKALLETFTATLTEQLGALKTEESKEPGKKPAATDLSQNPEFRALKKQNEEIAAQLAAEKLEKAAATTKARNEALHRKVESDLAALGIVDPKSARLILQGEGLVSYEDDDTDNVVFKDEGGALPLKKGLESWAKSAVGKRFMPASSASGSGERSRGGREASKGASNGAVSEAELGASLAEQLGIAVQ